MKQVIESKFWPAAEVRIRPIGEVRPSPRNVRLHSERQLDQIRQSLREYGWTTAVLVDEDGQIIAGHGRVEAAKREGLTEIPVAVAAGWTETQRRAYALADNRIPLNAAWDGAALGIELGELSGLGVDLGTLGFDDQEIGDALHPGTDGLTDPDEVPDEPLDPVSRPGDVWILGSHRLLCGDATVAADVAMALAGGQPHLMVTDPPYGVNYEPKWRAAAGVNNNRQKLGEVLNDDRADWRSAWVLFPGEVAYVWHATLFSKEVQESLEACEFKVRSQIIWAKDRFALSRGGYHWQHEPCWYAVRKGGTGHWAGDRSQSTLWQIAARDDSGLGHGTQKPVECMRRPIANNSTPGDAVYEPFSGSGTTIIAAEMTGRACIAIELKPGYVDVAIDRWQRFTGRQVTLEGDGRSFGEVATERLRAAA